MPDIQRQIDYWLIGAGDDLLTAGNPELPDTKSVTTYFNQTKQLLEWIKAKL